MRTDHQSVQSGPASCYEVKQHSIDAPTLKCSETKSCLPCYLLNSGKSFHRLLLLLLKKSPILFDMGSW